MKLILIILLVPFTSAYAVDVMIDAKHSGEFTANNVRVSDKEFYKVVHVDMQLKVKNMELEDAVFIASMSVRLINENGKPYLPSTSECKIQTVLAIQGINGGIGSFSTCYRVEKQFDTFQLQYHNDILGTSYEIGKLDLKQVDKVTMPKPETIKVPEPVDFFTKFLDLLRSLLGFR